MDYNWENDFGCVESNWCNQVYTSPRSNIIMAQEVTSYFGKRLQEDEELRKRCQHVVDTLQEMVREDIEAGERSERLTAEDLSTIINI